MYKSNSQARVLLVDELFPVLASCHPRLHSLHLDIRLVSMFFAWGVCAFLEPWNRKSSYIVYRFIVILSCLVCGQIMNLQIFAC